MICEKIMICEYFTCTEVLAILVDTPLFFWVEKGEMRSSPFLKKVQGCNPSWSKEKFLFAPRWESLAYQSINQLRRDIKESRMTITVFGDR